MADQHAEKAVTVRPGDDALDAGRAVLDERNLQFAAFVAACLWWLADDPDTALATLARHWPAPRKPGRPRRR